MKKETLQISSIFIALALLSGCANVSSYSSHLSARNAVIQSQQKGFQEEYIETDNFILYALLHDSSLQVGQENVPHQLNNINNINKAKALHVYIEGDGLAWETRTKISKDPTPTIATALHLAENDPQINNNTAVLYLARPCQYILEKNKNICDNKYWTSHRSAPEVIDSTSNAIDQMKEKVAAESVILVGYSGGASVASLVAAKRDDVSFLASIAGNLDIDALTTYHKVTPMYGSLNPLDFAYKTKHIPQRHMSSSADSVVPPFISRIYCNEINQAKACVEVDSITHWGDWEDYWNYNY